MTKPFDYKIIDLSLFMIGQRIRRQKQLEKDHPLKSHLERANQQNDETLVHIRKAVNRSLELKQLAKVKGKR